MANHPLKNNKKRRTSAEINVVPYIDVMLVLLVIFMITAPMLQQGVQVNLPKTEAKAMVTEKEPPIVVSVDKQGIYYSTLNENPKDPIALDTLVEQVSVKLMQAKADQKEIAIYIKGDKDVDYGKVVEAMASLQKIGAEHIGLITDPN